MPGDPSSGAMPPDPFGDALVAARLCAIDPGLAGMILRGGGELCDAVIEEVRAALPQTAPMRRAPVHIDDDRLLGGIDLFSGLVQGVRRLRTGLLAEADGGIVVIPTAERLSDATAGRLAVAMDVGEVVVERDGATSRDKTHFLTIALDEGDEPEERVPAMLSERVAFWIDLSCARHRYHGSVGASEPPLSRARESGWPSAPRRQMFDAESETIEARVRNTLVATAAALGVDSSRATLFALRACRASARLAGRRAIGDADIALAARLVLAPRATRIPAEAGEPPPEAPSSPQDDDRREEGPGEPRPLDDVVLAAVLATLPKDLLTRIAAGNVGRGRTTRGARAGDRRKSVAHGRPLGARTGMPSGGRRLSLIDTLRAAAPWQKMRGGTGRVAIRREDLRIRRFETRAQAVTIFVVDASGSSALARLAEAKGAVELMLAEAYVKRAHVALIAFRGTSAELLLPPTRSLTRARRSLAELPGGGGTPLAAGLNASFDLAQTVRSRGYTPFIVVLTDGRANIAADGRAERTLAVKDATAAAEAIAAADIQAAFLDISPRARPEGAVLAAKMRARYLPLPRADAATMHAAVSAARAG